MILPGPASFASGQRVGVPEMGVVLAASLQRQLWTLQHVRQRPRYDVSFAGRSFLEAFDGTG